MVEEKVFEMNWKVDGKIPYFGNNTYEEANYIQKDHSKLRKKAVHNINKKWGKRQY